MKIAIIIPTLETAGAEVMCKNLALELHKRNLDVFVISMYERQTAISQQLKQEGIKVVFLNKKLGFDPKMVFALKTVFDKERPTVAHTHLDCLKYVAFAAKLSGIHNCVHTVHNMAEKESGGVARIANFIIFKAFKVIPVALNPEVKMSIARLYHLSPKKVPIIHNGINLNECIPKTSYHSDGKLTFVHVGRFSQQKNHQMLIEAFKEFVYGYENSELLLVGKGDLLDDMKKLTKDYALLDKILFLEERKDVFEILHNADVFLLPSFYEGMPMSIIEAMGTGLPIIATEVGGIPSMIQDKETGYLIPCNKDDLILAMKYFANEKAREMYGKKALQYAHNHFSASIMADEYCKIYDGIEEQV